jgi:hypothetical protein
MRMANPRTSTLQMMPTMSVMSELMPIPGSGFSVTMLGTRDGRIVVPGTILPAGIGYGSVDAALASRHQRSDG